MNDSPPKNRYTPASVLVTGGAGFIGANFVRHLLENHAGLSIVNLDNLTYAGSLARLRGLPDGGGYRFVEGDICDADLVAGLLREFAIDTIVHFAAESHVDRSIEDPAVFVKTNVLGTYTLLHCASAYWLTENGFTPQQCRFHHISTDEVYGSLDEHAPAFTEAHAYLPSSPYSATKAGSDHLARAYFHTFGLPVTISNCSNNYGPGQHREKFIPTVIDACLRGETIPVYGDGRQVRDWLYVDDHCRGIDAILRRGVPGETYNIGANDERSNIEVAEEICARFDRLAPENGAHARLISHVADRPGHDRRYAIDNRKIKRELGWRARVPFAGGLDKTIEFYRRGQIA